MHNAAEITLRFLGPCFYDEPLAVHTRVAALGRSSAVLENAITGDGPGEIRMIARVVVVCMRDERSAP
jgi:acyl-CoA thioesterase FadM